LSYRNKGAATRNAELEIKRLQKRLEELETENEILKKFQAFSKEIEKSNTHSSANTLKRT
jgi:transposase